MGLFSKKDETPMLPDLPEDNSMNLPKLSELPHIEHKFQNQNLTPLPESNHQIDQNTIKQEINPQMQKSSFNISPSSPPRELIAEPVRHINHEETRAIDMNPEERQIVKRIDPIFVRLDKFETSLGALDEIKDRVVEIEKILVETKKLREKEDKELEEWENDIQIIKSKLDSIDNNIFSKLE
jgi:hypothetical protein